MTKQPGPMQWYVDALQRQHEIRHGALPIGAEDIGARLGKMTGEEVNALDRTLQEENESNIGASVTVGHPFKEILGYTKDGMIAYYGLHKMGAMPAQELFDIMDEWLREGDAEMRSDARRLKDKIERFLNSNNRYSNP